MGLSQVKKFDFASETPKFAEGVTHVSHPVQPHPNGLNT